MKAASIYSFNNSEIVHGNRAQCELNKCSEGTCVWLNIEGNVIGSSQSI